MRKSVNIIVGRFQPFTQGHMKCVIEAWEKHGVPTVICMIDVKDEKVNESRPFPSSLLLPIYENTLYSHLIDSIKLVSSADIVKIGEMLWNDGYEIISWTCGTDRYSGYLRQSINYKVQAHLPEKFDLIEVVRGDDDISASQARQFILNNDEKSFNEITGELYNSLIFNILRKQLLTI